MSKKLDETAAAGSVGAASIAVNPSAGFEHSTKEVDDKSTDKKIKQRKKDSFINFYKIVTTESILESERHAEHEWRQHVKKDMQEEEKYARMREQIAKAKTIKKDKSKKSFKDFFRKKVNEEYDLSSVVSNLKGLEKANADNLKDTAVSYGIEDDKGNFMRVTVPSNEAKNFEMAIARKLADNENNPINNINNKKESLAEILFNLQKQFTILDVEFPIIPKNAVYNKNDASASLTDQNQLDNELNTNEDQNMDNTDMNMDDQNLSDENAPNAEDMNNMEDSNELEDFGSEEASPNDPATLLRSLVDMLKKQAEAETAKANASAEQARATQAEWSAIAANKEVERQEEMARVKADLDEKKRREKMAKEYADLARYNVEQGKSKLNNMAESILYSAILEDIDIDNIPALEQQKAIIQKKYQFQPQDTQLDKNYKTAALKLELAQITSKINLIKLTQQYDKQKSMSTNNNQNQPQQPQTQQPQTQQPNQNQPQQPQSNQNQPQQTGGNA